MADKLPEHVVKQYGSSRAFRAKKRRLVKDMRRLLSDLRLGCAYFPSGARGVENIDYELKILARELSAKSWGR